MNATTPIPTIKPKAAGGKADEKADEKEVKGPFLTTCAALCRALRQSGTGNDKLNVLRDLLTKNPNATAEEGYDALDRATNIVVQRTLDKARGLIDRGEVPGDDTPATTTPIEDVILGPTQGTLQQRAEAGKAATEKLSLLEAERIAFRNQGLNEQQLTSERAKWEAEHRAAIEAEVRAKLEKEVADKAKAEADAVEKANKSKTGK